MDFDQLERDLAPFIAANEGNISQGDRAVGERIQMLAWSIVNKHLPFFSTFFATSLSQLDASLSMRQPDGSMAYAFKNVNDAADGFEMAVTQVTDRARSSAICLAILMIFLKSVNRNPTVTAEENEAALRVAAHLVDDYRLAVMREIIAMGSDGVARKQNARLFKWVAVAIGVAGFWWFYKR